MRLASVQVAVVFGHTAQGDHAFDAREIAGHEAIRVIAADAADVLGLVIDRVGG